MRREQMNVLWIMADQLRWDYLSCYGHPSLKTPNLDALAARGVRFDRAYVQSPICGASRMSFYTGRYVRSHGSTWNGFPLRVGELTLGDHLAPLGVRTVLVGKTHMTADLEGMARLGIDPKSAVGVRVAQCGFEPYERDDGLHPDGGYDPDPRYDEYLRRHGFGGENPWDRWANSAEDEDGRILSGWLMRNCDRPARIPEEHSETPYITRRAMDFMSEARGPWLCHLSYIKPHWPYIAPAPYHNMYGSDDIAPPMRSPAERETDHPLYRAYQNHRVSKAFSRDEVRERVVPAYMGLVKQIDDQIGELFAFMERRGLMLETMIVFTSDHGDYLGDHWLGEKDFFHDAAVKAPLIVYDPRQASDTTRGSTSELLVEGIDLAPTFLEFFGGGPVPHIIEGRSLMPLLHGRKDAPWRKYAISEYDYATRDARLELGVDQADARMIMVRDRRWKYIHAEGFRPMLFDLEADPDEFLDFGADPKLEPVRQRLRDAIFRWACRHHNRTTLTPQQIDARAGTEPPGILIGFWDEEEVERGLSTGRRRIPSTARG
jgi:arylsulfatase A-like enzyme